MEGFIGRRDLLDRAQLQTLSRKSDLAGAVQLGSHLTALAASSLVLAATWGTWWAIPAFLVQGTLLNFLYCAQHELSHATVFRTRWLNEWVGRGIGFLQLYPRDFDQIQHFAHHRHTGDWEKDSELQRAPYTLLTYLLFVLGPSYWWSRVSRLVRLGFGIVTEPYVRDDEKPRVIREARWHLGLYALVALVSVLSGSWLAVQLWLTPLLATKWTYMLQGSQKHLGRPHSSDLFENTRTAKTGALLHWLGWNMQYHTAHHLFPSVPFHRLPELHRAVVAKAGREPPSMTYLAFQRRVLALLARGRGEADFKDDDAWIT